MKKLIWTNKREAARFLAKLFRAKRWRWSFPGNWDPGRVPNAKEIEETFGRLEKLTRRAKRSIKIPRRISRCSSGRLSVLYIVDHNFCVYGTENDIGATRSIFGEMPSS